MNPYRTLRSTVRVRRFETDRVERRLARAASVDDLRRIAKRRLPGGVFDYIDGGAEDEITVAANSTAYSETRFVPRVLRGIDKVDVGSVLLGRAISYPLVLAPTGLTRIADPAGELAVARAAAVAGVPYTLSTLSTRSIEEVRAVSDGPLWFQVYLWHDRALVKDMVDRARSERYDALVLTVDTPVLGRRERDVRRGFTLPPSIGASTFIDGTIHPGWTYRFLTSEPMRFANVVSSAVGSSVGNGASPVSLADFVNTQYDPALAWTDLEWLRSIWAGPILIKGVQTVADARLAVQHGATGVILSNHGGRQLDGSPPTFGLIRPVRDAVGDDFTVICDGGVRRGGDIVKAVASGADAVMAGRAYLYALAAAGEQGVERLLMWWHADMVRTLNLIGAANVEELDGTVIEAPQPR